MAARIDVTIDELQELHGRVRRQELRASDYAIIGALVSSYMKRYEARMARLIAKAAAATAAAASAAVAKAATDTNAEVIDVEYKVIDRGAEGAAASPAAPSGAGDADGAGTAGAAHNGGASPECAAEGKDGDQPKPPGHGRNGAAAYTNASHFNHPLADGIVGSRCTCGKGCMYTYRETTTIRIVGQPTFGAEAHHYQQARCKMCGRVTIATGPKFVNEGIGKAVVYAYSACAMLIVKHYFGGEPFKRIESFHQSWGIPLADANQWDVARESDRLLRALYDATERVGMRTATGLGIDDTGGMVISIMRQIKAEMAAAKRLGKPEGDVRTGINATGVRLDTPTGIVVLFATGLHHAGEIFNRLMKYRDAGAPKLVKTTDAATKNFDHDYADKVIEAICHAHCYLLWLAIKGKYPAEYAIAAEIYKKIFDNDDVARDRRMTPEERMAYHAAHSKPLLEELKAMCVKLVGDKLVEPSGALWEPVSFVINQWPRLSKFYEEPGVPLHTNLVEQILITVSRYLGVSFNYQTENGSGVGDRHMSLIVTAKANDVEPVAYLEHCLRNHEDLAKRPEHYLPWVYRDRMKLLDQPLDLPLQKRAVS
jgi:hypothetical protein